MKNLTLFFAIIFSTQYNAQKESQIIFNEVPIHFSFDNDIKKYEYWGKPGVLLKQFDRQLNDGALPVQEHYELVNYIMKNVESGKIKIYEPDLFAPFISPEEFFKKPMSLDKETDYDYYIQYPLSNSYALGRIDEMTGDIMFDELTGKVHYEMVIEPLLQSDFVSFTFVEEWEFDTKNSIMLKRVLGFTANTLQIDETRERIGTTPRFYVKLNAHSPNENNWKVANNFISRSIVNGPTRGKRNAKKEELQRYWWENNIETSKRHKLIQPLFSGDFNYIEAAPPYSKTLADKNKALYKYEKSPIYDELGNELYDFVGEQMYHTDTSLYSYLDINKLGFIEDWYFDTINCSFRKEVKAIMPCALNYNETGELLKSIPLFLINMNGNTISQEVNGFSLENHKSPLILVNVKIKDLDNIREEIRFHAGNIMNENLLKENSITIDSVAQVKMNSFFINYPSSEGANMYTSLFYNDYQIEKNTKSLMNKLSLIERIDNDTGDLLYDENFGNQLYDSILIPYVNQDITGFKFIEDWNYDIAENQFDISITGVIPMIWYTNPEIGDIVGTRELYMAKPKSDSKGKYTLLKSNHIFTEPLRQVIGLFDDFWYYKENTEWLYPQKRKELITSLLEGIKSKKTQVIAPYNNEKIKWKNRESYVGDITFADIGSIQFEEDIYFNYESGHFKKTVKSVTFILEGLDDKDRWNFPWLKIIFSEK
jgi:hypothetical protein